MLRTTYYKYLHPKEVFISNGILNKELIRAGKGLPKPRVGKDLTEFAKNKLVNKFLDTTDSLSKNDGSGLSFVYPFGSTLNVQKPAFPLLSS